MCLNHRNAKQSMIRNTMLDLSRKRNAPCAVPTAGIPFLCGASGPPTAPTAEKSWIDLRSKNFFRNPLTFCKPRDRMVRHSGSAPIAE